MKLSDFDFDLPEHLIAQHPPEQRGESRLLFCGENQVIEDLRFCHIINLLQPNDVLIVNDTKVLKARLEGFKSSGGKVEVMLERILDSRCFTALIRANKPLKIGSDLVLADIAKVRVKAKQDMMYELEILETSLSLTDLLDAHGTLPLPPYIEHIANTEDNERYQTVFARSLGAVAAPTAGLHFTEDLLAQIKSKGVNIQSLTLHVGAGTFLPVKTDNVEEHVMHSERYAISGELIAALLKSKQNGGNIVAVGTTSLRALEAWACETGSNLNSNSGMQTASLFTEYGHSGDTEIFIKPGYDFKIVDRLITNFHLPKSTLLMLVSAFAGKSNIFNAYMHAISKEYKFFSYGDAMWLDRFK
jgi:S-adenosylmethionine:tRNA ribosyltransferase-isomerase